MYCGGCGIAEITRNCCAPIYSIFYLLIIITGAEFFKCKYLDPTNITLQGVVPYTSGEKQRERRETHIHIRESHDFQVE